MTDVVIAGVCLLPEGARASEVSRARTANTARPRNVPLTWGECGSNGPVSLSVCAVRCCWFEWR